MPSSPAAADHHAGAAIVTWNTKDFDRRTTVPVLMPDAFFSDMSGD
jgi:hypothetical protein